MPPSGLAAKPTAYVENAASVPAVELNSGKNSSPKISAAAVPYRKKSYHSIAVPIKLASATCRIELICPSRSPPNLSMISFRGSRPGFRTLRSLTRNDPITHEPAQPGLRRLGDPKDPRPPVASTLPPGLSCSCWPRQWYLPASDAVPSCCQGAEDRHPCSPPIPRAPRTWPSSRAV